MATRIRRSWTDQQKEEIIAKYKQQYLASKRSTINGEKATEELFDALTLLEQWNKIKLFGKFKKDYPAKKSAKKSEDKFTYHTVRSAIGTLKKSIDFMNKNQIGKMFKELEELQPLVDNKAKAETERMNKQKRQKLAGEKKELLEKLKEIEELEKELEK